MKYYKFLETARIGKIHLEGKIPPQKIIEQWQDIFLSSVPFVFTKTEEQVDLHVEHLSTLGTLSDPVVELDLPFKTCFFEILSDSINTMNDEHSRVNVDGLLIHETAPKSYQIFILITEVGEASYTIGAQSDIGFNNYYLAIAENLIARLGKEEIGLVNPRHSIKVKSQGQKISHRINRVIYVVPKKSIPALEQQLTRSVDWSHRWAVRGHWRSIPNRIGHDRDGQPIADFTWIKDHVKGPENAPIVNKTRVVR